jgi:hypothetical protein
LFFAACSHAAAPVNTSPPPPPGGGAATGSAAASQCPAIAEHLLSLMSASSVVPPEQLEPFRKVIATRCTEDLWTAQAQQCFAEAKSLEDADKCQPNLTPAQQETLQRDGQAAAQQSMSPKGDVGTAPTPAPPADEAPAPAPGGKDKRSTRGPAKTGGDPCEGGE